MTVRERKCACDDGPRELEVGPGGLVSQTPCPLHDLDENEEA